MSFAFYSRTLKIRCMVMTNRCKVFVHGVNVLFDFSPPWMAADNFRSIEKMCILTKAGGKSLPPALFLHRGRGSFP